jgi:hypothetical protein
MNLPPPTRRPALLAGWILLAVGLGARGAESAPPVAPETAAFFETKIRPLLIENCFSCHSDKKQKGSLRLDSLAALKTGGDRGPVIVPGAPEKSLLIQAVGYADPDLHMPPKKKLSKVQIEDLTRWVRMGAPWPGTAVAVTEPAKSSEFKITDKDRAFWSFQPIRRPHAPQPKDNSWVANPIDAFIFGKLEEKGLHPNSEASKRDLLRRAYFDLIGLPPSAAEVEAFVRDPAADSWERQIDRLLSLPQYGERWGRHWLDLVRYAQTSGYERDEEKPYAWRYRDYVIRAFNEDKPYNQFIVEQLAGDQLAPVTADGIIASGFYRLGVWDDEPDDARQAAFDELDDIVATTGQAFLGLTVNCARCHDHKFDPISQRDYYRLLAFVHNIRGNERARFEKDSATYTLLGTKEWALSVRDKTGAPPVTHVLFRGNAATPGEEVQPGFLEVLDSRSPARSLPRRRALAEWIASPDNPLTARVLVNWLWQHHFGRGLVPTPNDFGKTGVAPTHPELLDWLAADFIAGGWKMKRLHKQIMMSRAYRLSSHTDNTAAVAVDEGNSLFWRQNLRRLEAEALRDAALAVSGNLDGRMNGRGIFPRLDREIIAGQSRPGLGWEISNDRDLCRRSIYIFVKRTMLAPMLEGFDYSNTAQSLGDRPITTVAPQALLLLNSDFMQEQAEALAHRISREVESAPAAQVRQAYRLALGRLPTDPEQQIALDYLERQTRAFATLKPPLTFYPRVSSSLSTGYLQQLKPADFLGGPAQPWQYYRGAWSKGYEGINTVEAQRGPFALWPMATVGDAVIEGQLLLHPASERASVLFRAVPRGEVFEGYEVSLDPRKGIVSLRRHEEKGLKMLAEAPAVVAASQWHHLKIEAAGARLRVWFDCPNQPLLDVTDPKPFLRPGQVGVHAWGSPLSVEDFLAVTDGQTLHLGDKPATTPAQARRQALKSFCLVMLNLNEFAYVD